MPPEEMTGSTHILEFTAVARAPGAVRRVGGLDIDDGARGTLKGRVAGFDEHVHKEGPIGRDAPHRNREVRRRAVVVCRLPDWVLAAAGSSVVRAAVFGYSSNKFLRINEDGPRGKSECISLYFGLIR